MLSNQLTRFSRITFSELLLRWKLPYPFGTCYICALHDLTDLGMIETQYSISHGHATARTNFWQIMNTLEHFCSTRLDSDPFWPIPIQCCILAVIFRDHIVHLSNDEYTTRARVYDSPKNIFSPTQVGTCYITRNILSIYNKYYSKYDFPRLYAMLLQHTRDTKNIDSCIEIINECIDLLRYRLKVTNVSTQPATSHNYNHGGDRSQIQQALDSYHATIFSNSNAIIEYVNYCKQFIVYMGKTPRPSDEKPHTYVKIVEQQHVLYQLFQDLFKLQSQFDINTTCEWNDSTRISTEVGQCCSILFTKFVTVHWMFEILAISTVNCKKKFQYAKNYPQQDDIVLSLMKKFVCAFIKLHKSMKKSKVTNRSNYTKSENVIYLNQSGVYDTHNHPQTDTDLSIDTIITVQDIEQHLTRVRRNLKMSLLYLSIHYLVCQPRNEQTLSSALFAATMSNEFGKLVTGGDCEQQMTLAIECCIHFIRKNWQKYDEIISKIGILCGTKSLAFNCCDGLRLFKDTTKDNEYRFKLRYADLLNNSIQLRIMTTPYVHDKLEQQQTNIYTKYSHPQYLYQDPLLTFNKRWDIALSVIAAISQIPTMLILKGGYDGAFANHNQRKDFIFTRFFHPEHDTDPTIEFLSNLCQLKQCDWKKCKRKDVKLRRCKKCKKVLYCSKLCQKKHWINGHREICVFSRECN